MNITFSDHAQDKMVERNVDETEVERAIKSPDRRVFTVRNRRIVLKEFHDRIIIIIYTIENGLIIVVTVMVNE